MTNKNKLQNEDINSWLFSKGFDVPVESIIIATSYPNNFPDYFSNSGEDAKRKIIYELFTTQREIPDAVSEFLSKNHADLVNDLGMQIVEKSGATRNIEELLNKEKKRREDALKKDAERISEKPKLDFWKISKVIYRGGIYTVDLAKSLLENGASKNQEAWAVYSDRAKEKNEFHVGDMPLYHALFTSLFRLKDLEEPEVKEARQFIEKQMDKNNLITLTRVIYQPLKKDRIIHNYGTSEKYELLENIVGMSGCISTFRNTAYLKAILGTSNAKEIDLVYNWLNRTHTHIQRSDSNQYKECAGYFNTSSRGTNFDYNQNLQDGITLPTPALGIRVHKEKEINTNDDLGD